MVHFVYWCRLASGLSGPLHRTKDFIHAVQYDKDIGFVTVFANNPDLKEMEKNGEIKVIITKETRRFRQFFFLLSLFSTLLRMLRIRWGSGITVFYFRYTSFLLLPLLLRALGEQNIYLELNGIPNQDLLENRKKPLLRYLRKRLLFLYDRILLQSVDKVFTVCEVFKKNLLEKYRITKDINVIPNGYFPEEVPLLDRNLAKERLGLDPKMKYSIYVGHLTYYEGVEFLVQSFLHLCDYSELKDNVLLILGEHGLEERLKRMVPPAMAKRVVFMGFVPKEIMRLYIAAAHVGVYTPLEVEYGIDGQRGGNPLKIVDYLSMGRPVLVPRAAYYGYVDRYEIGARYEVSSKKSFVQTLTMITEDEAKNRRWGRNARNYAINHLDWRCTLTPVYSMIDRHAQKGDF